MVSPPSFSIPPMRKILLPVWSFILGFSISSTLSYTIRSSIIPQTDTTTLFDDKLTPLRNVEGDTRIDESFYTTNRNKSTLNIDIIGLRQHESEKIHEDDSSTTSVNLLGMVRRKQQQQQEQNEGNNHTITIICDKETIPHKHKEYNDNDSINHENNMQFQKETAIIISTHLIPSHPSLSSLLEVLDSVRKYLVGLPDKCPIYITVDGIKEKQLDGKEDRLLLYNDKENRDKYDSYLKALYDHFRDDDNVKILVAGKNIGLVENLRRAVLNLEPWTNKYMYLLQHDLPFSKAINHTAIVKTANEYPEINMIRFSKKRNMKLQCVGVPDIKSVYGISLRKGIKWSDQVQFAQVSHYINDLFPILSVHFFPENKMIGMSIKNCTYFGPYYYEKGFNGPWFKHTDATERYGEKLAERVKHGAIDVSYLSNSDLDEMKRAGVNTTELLELVTKNSKSKR